MKKNKKTKKQFLVRTEKVRNLTDDRLQNVGGAGAATLDGCAISIVPTATGAAD